MCSALLLLALSLGCGCAPARSEPAADKAVGASSCHISLVDESHFPTFSVHRDALATVDSLPGTRKAYFAMGCFWGSESMLGSLPGVLGTRVGFSGGTAPDPSYSNIGDHVETVEVTYDPQKVTYQQLLDHFWAHHNARAKPIFRQYASAIFCETPQEETEAKAERASLQEKGGTDKLLTAILPFKAFYPASDNHQKYYLQQDKALFKALQEQHLALNSVLATKLNSVAGADGDRAQLARSLSELGLEPEVQAELFRRARWPEPR